MQHLPRLKRSPHCAVTRKGARPSWRLRANPASSAPVHSVCLHGMRTSSSAYAPATPSRTVHELLHRGTGHHRLRDRFAARVVPPVRLGPGCSAVLAPLLVKSSLTILHARVGHYNPAAGPSTSHARIHHHRVSSRRSLLFLTVPSCCTAVASRAPCCVVLPFPGMFTIMSHA